jgi:exonuclease SbcD
MLGRDVVVPKSALAVPAWDYVALGHIHRHQELNKGQQPPIVYAGSLERIDFGEEKEPKGFVIADVRRGQADWEFHRVEARRFVTIREDVRDQADPLAALTEAISRYNIADAIVRVIVQAQPEQEGLLRDGEIRRALDEAYFVAGISKEMERAYRQRLGGESPEGLTPAQLLEHYLKSKDTPPERVDALLKQAQSIFQADS